MTSNEKNSESSIATAYNAVATDYDSQLEQAQWVRERLWARMDSLFPAKSHVLDVTAGTGLDIVHLMERGVSVVACDISRVMLNRLHEKSSSIQSFVADFNHLGITAQFDGIISTFAGLNTSANLHPFAERAAQLLRPGGALFIHMLNRWPLQNMARQVVKLQWLSFWHSLTAGVLQANIGGISVHHYLHSPQFLYDTVFADHFRLIRIEGHGIVRRIHHGGKQFEKPERWLASRPPFYSFGAFFLLELIRIK